MLKVTFDPSGLYAATSSADKTVLLFDIYMGECIAKLSGHSGKEGRKNFISPYFPPPPPPPPPKKKIIIMEKKKIIEFFTFYISEVVTGLKFSRDCKYLYTVSGDR